MKELEALELYKELKAIIYKIQNVEERNRLNQLVFCDVDFITEGSLKEYNKTYEVCKGIVVRMANGVRNLYSQQELDDIALDATIKIMDKIQKNNILVENITNFSWLWCRAQFTTYPMLKQNVFEREIIYTDDLENLSN